MDHSSGGGSKGSSRKDEQSLANQKFDALFGGGSAPEPKEADANLEKAIKSSLAPVAEEGAKSARKQSGTDPTNKDGSRKQSGYAVTAPIRNQGPRKKYDRKVLIARFKQRKEIDMGVFE